MRLRTISAPGIEPRNNRSVKSQLSLSTCTSHVDEFVLNFDFLSPSFKWSKFPPFLFSFDLLVQLGTPSLLSLDLGCRLWRYLISISILVISFFVSRLYWNFDCPILHLRLFEASTNYSTIKLYCFRLGWVRLKNIHYWNSLVFSMKNNFLKQSVSNQNTNNKKFKQLVYFHFKSFPTPSFPPN